MSDMPVLLVSYGDAGGIGPELVARTIGCAEATRGVRRLIAGPVGLLDAGCRAAGMDRPDLPLHADLQDALDDPAPVVLLDDGTVDASGLAVGAPSEAAGAINLADAERAAALMAAGQVQGFVYAPMNKLSLKLAGSAFEGYPGYVVHCTGQPVRSWEINTIGELWTIRVTSHIALSEVSSRITRDAVLEVIDFFERQLRGFGYARPRIAVSGLNPHNGDGGLFGREEIDEIGPAVELARKRQFDVAGPFPPDTIFLTARNEGFLGVVSMYHDQCQIATKLLGFDEGVTYFGGLPMPLATPAHGTAYDIAGQGRAKLTPMLNALKLATRAALNGRG